MSTVANAPRESLPKANSVKPGSSVVVLMDGIEALIQALICRGYDVLGPQVRDGAIVYGPITSSRDLPAGWTDEQQNGKYRLKRRRDGALFGYVLGPHSWKRYLYPPIQKLWSADRSQKSFDIAEEQPQPAKLALLGVRACELHAIALQDKIFLRGPYVDPGYQRRRQSLFIVAVNCSEPGGTCFCASTDTGPKATSGYDLAITELLTGNDSKLLISVGSGAGAELLSEIPSTPPSKSDEEAAAAVSARAAARMGRKLETGGLKELLYRNVDNPLWDKVAARCLSCANCTMVCPTCFCTTVEDTTDLTGSKAERWRRWDSCFTLDFSYIHGGSVRVSAKSRYRQWMTHKLAAWIDQFGRSGCVGCGRCITWCPVGIDITAEAQALRDSEVVKPGLETPRSSHDTANP